MIRITGCILAVAVITAVQHRAAAQSPAAGDPMTLQFSPEPETPPDPAFQLQQQFDSPHQLAQLPLGPPTPGEPEPPAASGDAVVEEPVVRPARRRNVYTRPEIVPSQQTQEKIDDLIADVLLPEASLDLDLERVQTDPHQIARVAIFGHGPRYHRDCAVRSHGIRTDRQRLRAHHVDGLVWRARAKSQRSSAT